MHHIWNIYQTGDPLCPGPDPYDIFVYAVRKDEEPWVGNTIFVEGKVCHVIATTPDYKLMEVNCDSEQYIWKVCVG